MMDIRLDGKRARVCGSTQGIGLACAKTLAQQGARVTLLARNPEKLEAALETLPASDAGDHDTLVADFADADAVRSAIRGAVDAGAEYHVLVNNTGGPPGGRAIDAEPGAFETGFRMHVVGNQILTQAVVPAMRRAKYGRIINIISTSVKAPIPGLGVSNTIRGAVANWAKTLSAELGPDGITVNNVLPGYTDTARLRSLFAKWAEARDSTPDRVRDDALQSIPARRLAAPEEIAYAVAFLASPAAAYISGINVPVDGGRTPSL